MGYRKSSYTPKLYFNIRDDPGQMYEVAKPQEMDVYVSSNWFYYNFIVIIPPQLDLKIFEY